MQRPDSSEYFEYYGTYVGKVPDGDILSIFEAESEKTDRLLRALPGDAGDIRYAPGKWSVKQVLSHLIDTERMFATRALAFARRDPNAYPGFEQDDYAAESRVDGRTLDELADELKAVRQSTIHLFRSFDDEVSRRKGTANGKEFSVRAAAYIIAGHEIHHRGILVDRYLS